MLSLALAVTLCGAPATMRAQADQPTTNRMMLALADSLTVGDYCTIAQRAVASRAVILALGADSVDTRTYAAIICDPLVSDLSLLALAGRAPAPISAVARLHTAGSSVARRRMFDAMSEFRSAVNRPSRLAAVQAAMGQQDFTKLTLVTETADAILTMDARDNALARLANYERKLGPTSARLNGPEVLLNYAAQLWIPFFKATPLGGPSPWEIVASYSPAYVTPVDGGVQPVSASEFGVRYYLFGERFGKTGVAGLLRPSYWSAGVLTASDRNGALVWPWEGKERVGGYVSWGAVKVGYINGRQGEWLVSKQFQAVPFVF
jgi:hypothetical protein